MCAGIWLIYLWIYGSFPISWSLDIYHILRAVLAPLPSFWLIIFLVPVTCVLPSFMLQQLARFVAIPIRVCTLSACLDCDLQ